MTLTDVPGASFVHPHVADWLTMPLSSGSIASAGAIDATGEKYAVVGRVWWADRGTHDIRGFGWRPGTVVSAGGSLIDCSLQDLDTTTGAPSRPDGNKDQTVNLALSALTSNTWREDNFSTDRTNVAHGSLLAVVWEFDAGGRLGADSLSFSGITAVAGQPGSGSAAVLLTASWAQATAHPIVVLKGADGAVGTIGRSFPAKALNSHAFNSGSTPDEIANSISFPASVTLEGVEIPLLAADGADVSLILYEGTTAIETVTADEDTMPTGSATLARWRAFWFSTPRTLTANTTYRLAIRPDTANNITTYSMDVNTADQLDLLAGQDFHYWDRTNAGAWSNENTTRWIFMRLLISQVDSGAGGGGPMIMVQ